MDPLQFLPAWPPAVTPLGWVAVLLLAAIVAGMKLRVGTSSASKAERKSAATGAGKRAASPTQPGATPALPAATAAPAPGAQCKSLAPAVQAPTGEERYRRIAHAAYLRAEKRGVEPGREIDDWLAADAEFVAAFRAG